MSLLYVNACVRENSRTNRLARFLLSKYNGQVDELILNGENLCGLTADSLKKRDELISAKQFDDAMFKYARQFAAADIIIIAAPLWDLSFPALLKAYFERVNVVGVTFGYSAEGRPQTLCKAKRLIYVTTAGGIIQNDEFGFGYVKALCNTFYSIEDIKYFKAMGLDIKGNDPEKILKNTQNEIAEQMSDDSDFKF